MGVLSRSFLWLLRRHRAPPWKGFPRMMELPPVLFDADPEDFGKLTRSKFHASHARALEAFPPTLLCLPWGLLPQSMVAELVEPDHLASQHTRTGTRVHPESKTSARLLELLGGDKDVLCDGVLSAYGYVRKHFNLRTKTWAELDVLAPPLSQLFTNAALSYLIEDFEPCVETVEADAKLLGLWLEEGSADRPGKALGRFDADEIKYYLLAGFMGPELLMSYGGSGVLGGPPRRIVMAVCVEAMESFNVTDHTGFKTSQPPRLHKHYLVLETDWKMTKDQDPSDVDLNWRIRYVRCCSRPQAEAALLVVQYC